MIQGGGFTSNLVQSTTQDPIKLEVGKGLSNVERKYRNGTYKRIRFCNITVLYQCS